MSALDHLPAIVVELDPMGVVTDVGAAGAKLLGFTAEELRGQDWFERVIPRAARAAARREHRALLDGEGGELDERHLLDREGRERRVVWRAARQAEGRVVVVATPLGDRFSTDAEHQRTVKALEDIRWALDASTIVAITDRAGIITYVNDRFCAVSQYAREELIGKTHRVVSSGLHPPEFFALMWATISGGRVWRGDIANRAKDGHVYWVDTTIVPFFDADGRPYQYCAIRNEITERKLLEAELVEANRRIREEQAHVVQAEKLSSIGVLAAGVAHEINNPLAGVMACVKALRDQAMGEDRRKEYFATVLDGLERIQVTVRSLLDYSGQRSPHPSDLSVEELVKAVILLVRPALRKKDIDVQLELEPGARIYADRSQLMQALVNVTLNATYASSQRGRILFRAALDGDRTILEVCDSGPGFAAEVIGRACDPFFTTKPEGEGTGLGLAVTLSVVEANGGALELTNDPAGGAVVRLSIPRVRS